MQQCPKCQSDLIHRSRSRSRWEQWRKQITGKRPYRCSKCGWRGWAIESSPTVSPRDRDAAPRAVAPEPPNLAGTPLAPADAPPRDVDLHALDREELRNSQ